MPTSGMYNRTGAKPNYTNVNEYTISASGPIIKNKTFFFATWDQNIVLMRMLVRAQTLTNCARKGIYRYFSGWLNGNTSTKRHTTGSSTNTRAVVTADGTRSCRPLIGMVRRTQALGRWTRSTRGLIFKAYWVSCRLQRQRRLSVTRSIAPTICPAVFRTMQTWRHNKPRMAF